MTTNQELATKESMSPNQRAEKRFPVNFRRCWTPESAAILNVSLDGLALEALCRYEPGDRISVHMSPNGSGVAVDGVVQWCRPVAHVRIATDAVPIYHVGVQISGVGVHQEEWSRIVEIASHRCATLLCLLQDRRERTLSVRRFS